MIWEVNDNDFLSNSLFELNLLKDGMKKYIVFFSYFVEGHEQATTK